MIDLDQPDRPIYGLQIGVVVDRNDPESLGRVRVRIPGLIEPASPWAWPLGAPGGGSKSRGLWDIPNLGAEIGIFFKGGDPDQPYYMPANWGLGEVPSESEDGDPDVRTWETDEFAITIDDRPASKNLVLKDKSSGNEIKIDGITRSISLDATTEVSINATGIVRIDGLLVLINGVPAGFGRI
jgi:hypothetical protein